MKKLLILRHGKAQPDAPRGDHARELTERGRRDATAMGDYIRALVDVPDAFVTSDAARAFQTAELASAACGFAGTLTIEPRIYNADVVDLVEIVRQLPDSASCVVLVGHNPGFFELASVLSNRENQIDTLPTAGLVFLTFDGSKWNKVSEGSFRVRDQVAPGSLKA